MEDILSVVPHPKWFRRLSFAIFAFICRVLVAAPGDLDPAFNVNIAAPGNVTHVVGTPDGKLLIAGSFSLLGGIQRTNIARINSDGTVDASFDAGTAGETIRCIEAQPDGKVLVGGSFSTFNGSIRPFLVRLHLDGSVDETFDAHLEKAESTYASTVSCLRLQPDGDIVVAGRFRVSGGIQNHSLVRLNPSGTRDPSFVTSINNEGGLYDLLLQPDGKMILAGNISIGQPKTYFRAVRFNYDGTLDAGFQLDDGLPVPHSLALQPDGKILAALGSNLERWEPNGKTDRSFAIDPSPAIRTVALQADGRVLGAGDGAVRRFLPNGAIDTSFKATGGSSVRDIYLDPAGRVVFGGDFNQIGTTRINFLARLFGGDLQVPGAGEINLAWPAYSVREGSQKVEVWVVRTGGNSNPATINYSVSAGSAGTEDFVPSIGSLLFEAGETMKAISITIPDDLMVEADETLVVTLAEPGGGATLGSLANSTVTIIDDDKAGVLNWRNTTSIITEASAQLMLDVARSEGSFGEVSVEYEVTGGTANNGTDYVFANGTLMFADGESLKSVSIQILGDTLKEGHEDLIIQLSNPTGGAMIGSSKVSSVVIKDDDMPGTIDPTFSVPPPVFPTAQRVRAMLQLPDGTLLVADSQGSGALRRLNPDGSVDASFAPPFPNGASVKQIIRQPDGKLLLVGTSLQSFDGNSSNVARLNPDGSYDQSFVPDFQGYFTEYAALQPDGRILLLRSNLIIRVFSNGSLDSDFEVTGLSGFPGGLVLQPDGKILVFGSLGSFQGVSTAGLFRLHPDGTRDDTFVTDPSIKTDVVSVGVVTLQPDGKIIAGGGFGFTNGSRRTLIRLLPSGSLDNAFQTQDGVGIASLSFILLQVDGKIITNGGPILAGRNPYGSIVRLNSDGSLDPTFSISGFEPSDFGALSDRGDLFFSAVIGLTWNTRLVKVISGDLDLTTGGQLGFGWENYSVSESATHVTVHVVRKNGNSGGVSVTYATADGSALTGRDYTSETGTLTFGPGEIARPIEIPITNTVSIDGSRQFNISLRDPSGAVLGATANTTVTISDDEHPGKFQFAASNYHIREGGSLTVKVTRTAGADRQATIDYSAVSQTASNETDYIISPGTLDFADGEKEKTFIIQSPLDGASEGDERFVVKLANVTGGGELGNPASATITIQDDDDAGSFKSFALLGANSAITASAKMPDGKVLLAGAFVGGIRLVRLHPNGSIDAQFNSDITSGVIRSIAVEADGKVVLGGAELRPAGGLPRSVTRLNSDGTIDQSLSQSIGAVNEVRVVRVQSDGKIIIGGTFTGMAGTERPYLARLLENGALDSNFQPQVDYPIQNMVVCDDDAIVFATRPNKLVRLKADGALDPGFQVELSGSDVDSLLVPHCLAVDSRGRILVGGYFKRANGQPRLNMARLLRDGVLDTSFDAGSAFVEAPDVIEVQGDGRIFVGGFYLHAAGGVVRLYEDGPLDMTFNLLPVPATSWGHLTGLTVLEEAGLLVFGGFQEIDGVAQRNCALVLLGSRPGMFQFEPTDSVDVAEDLGTLTVTVKRVGGTEGIATVHYAAEPGSALEVHDYIGASGTLTFEDGEATKTFDVTLVDDSDYERSERFNLKLSSESGSFISAINRFLRVNVVDNETRVPGAVQFATSSIAINEEDGFARILVERVGGADDVVTVSFATVSDTAQSGKDFVQRSGTLTFEDEVTSQIIEIPLLDGCLAEEAEAFSIVLSDPALGAILGSPASVTVTINDSDTGTLKQFRGNYTGLLYSESDKMNGLIQLSVSAGATVSGYVFLAEKRYPFRGRMNADGELAISILRRGLTPIELTLAVDEFAPESEQISGTLNYGGWNFEFAADRGTYQAKANPAAAAGQYIAVLLPNPDDGLPQGSGYASFKVTKAGAVRLKGQLPDGSTFSRGSSLSKDNRWALYVPLYAKTGLLSGMMQLEQDPSWKCSGTATWEKPARPGDRYYPAGFTGTISVQGEARSEAGFAIPSGSSVNAELSGGGLVANLGPLDIGQLPNDTLRGSERLKFSISSSTGVITGQLMHPQTGYAIGLRGAHLPSEKVGAGFFLGVESSGAFKLTITPPAQP